LDFLLKRDMELNDFEAFLNKLEISPWVFYGLAVPHLKMASVINFQKTPANVFLSNVPEVLMVLLRPPPETFRKDKDPKYVAPPVSIFSLFY